MILPGPEAQQLAVYIRWRLHGKRGGVVAGTLFVLPSMFNGLKPAVIALVIVALQRLAKRALRGPVQCAVAAAAFAGIFSLHPAKVAALHENRSSRRFRGPEHEADASNKNFPRSL
jgi:chromate transporter